MMEKETKVLIHNDDGAATITMENGEETTLTVQW